MSYISLIRAFHKLNEHGGISCYATALYFMLLEECNTSRWKNPFNVETRRIQQRLGISRPTICKARKELEALGLLKFEDGKNGNQYSKYTLSNVSADGSECKGDLHYDRSEKRPSVNVANSSVNLANTDTLLYNKDIKTTFTDVKVPTAGADGLVKEGAKNVVEDRVGDGCGDKAPKTRKKPTPKKKTSPTLVSRAREVFEAYFKQEYGERYYWEGKDGKHMQGLLQKISNSRAVRDNPLPVDDDSLLDALAKFLASIEKKWVRNNFSVPTINSQYNNIITEIKNASNELKKNAGQNHTTQPGYQKVGADLSDIDRQQNTIDEGYNDADERWARQPKDQPVSDVTYTEVPPIAGVPVLLPELTVDGNICLPDHPAGS